MRRTRSRTRDLSSRLLGERCAARKSWGVPTCCGRCCWLGWIDTLALLEHHPDARPGGLISVTSSFALSCEGCSCGWSDIRKSPQLGLFFVTHPVLDLCTSYKRSAPICQSSCSPGVVLLGTAQSLRWACMSQRKHPSTGAYFYGRVVLFQHASSSGHGRGVRHRP